MDTAGPVRVIALDGVGPDACQSSLSLLRPRRVPMYDGRVVMIATHREGLLLRIPLKTDHISSSQSAWMS